MLRILHLFFSGTRSFFDCFTSCHSCIPSQASSCSRSVLSSSYNFLIVKGAPRTFLFIFQLVSLMPELSLFFPPAARSLYCLLYLFPLGSYKPYVRRKRSPFVDCRLRSLLSNFDHPCRFDVIPKAALECPLACTRVRLEGRNRQLWYAPRFVVAPEAGHGEDSRSRRWRVDHVSSPQHRQCASDMQ